MQHGGSRWHTSWRRVVRRELSAGGVVVRRMRGRWWLAAIRPRRDYHSREVWVLPKGHIEPGESDAEAAAREVYEETGLHARVETKLNDVRYIYTWEGERISRSSRSSCCAQSVGASATSRPGWRSRSRRRGGCRSTRHHDGWRTPVSGRWPRTQSSFCGRASIVAAGGDVRAQLLLAAGRRPAS